MEKLQIGWARGAGRMLEPSTDACSDPSIPRRDTGGLGSFKEALQGQTCEGEQQGCAGYPCSLSVLLPQNSWRFAQREGWLHCFEGRCNGKRQQHSSWLRASACWRPAPGTVPEALRPFTFGPYSPSRGDGGEWGARVGVRTVNLSSWLNGIIVGL